LFGLFRRPNKSLPEISTGRSNPFSSVQETLTYRFVEAGNFLQRTTQVEVSAVELAKQSPKSILEDAIVLNAVSYVSSSIDIDTIEALLSGNQVECRAAGTLAVLVTTFQCTRASLDFPELDLEALDVTAKVFNGAFSQLGSEELAELLKFSTKAASEALSLDDQRMSQLLEAIDALVLLFVAANANHQEEIPVEHVDRAKKIFIIIKNIMS
jgi:hypothetical protein